MNSLAYYWAKRQAPTPDEHASTIHHARSWPHAPKHKRAMKMTSLQQSIRAVRMSAQVRKPLSLALLGLMLSLSYAEESTPNAEQIAFFESKIRPVLVEHCYKCHSAEALENKKLKGGLYLDSRAGVLTGGDTGPAIIPGNAEKSLLMTALHWEDPDIEMPPKNKLPAAIIADFATWIAMGAPDPRTGSAPIPKAEIDLVKGRQHWAFAPFANTKAPEVRNNDWVRTPVDRFILARQEAVGVTPSSLLSHEKLIRRATFALLGLPPSATDVDNFIADKSPNAYPQLIDRLLANPAFGERWSRHWLDTVRYAESNGYEFDAYRPGAYHYRDWVIRALNSDLPYDQFIREQIAGDKLKPGDFDALSATGFLVAGPYPGQITVKTKERIRYDQLDDMVSTIGSSMLGLTIGCARCHDHKFDPLPQRDYYAMAAALAKTEHEEIKFDRNAKESARLLAEHDLRGQPLRAALKEFEERDFLPRFSQWQKDELPKLWSQETAPTPWQSLTPMNVTARSATLNVDENGHVLKSGKREKKDVYTIKALTNQRGLIAFRVDVFTGPDLPKKGPGLSDNGNFVLGNLKIIARPHDPAIKTKPITIALKAGVATFEQKDFPLSAVLDNSPDSGWGVAPKTGQDHAATFMIEGAAIGFVGGTELEFQLTFDHFGVGNLRLSFATEPIKTNSVQATTPMPVTEPTPTQVIPTLGDAVVVQNLGEIKTLLESGNGQIPGKESVQMRHWFTRFDQASAQLIAALREHDRQRPKPDLIPVYSTKTGGQDVYLLRRGEVDNKDIKSTPGYFQVLEDGSPNRWQQKADLDPRVGLGRWLTDADAGAGRLLARVMVNRVWKNLFGSGLVTTPNDFGLQGERPTHPELLDYLAKELIAGGWQLKPLLRHIMLSSVYLQGADEREKNRTLDPENKLWWQRPALRLEAEAIRDSLLSVSGRLDPTLYGPAIEDFNIPRRSVYLRVRRSELFPFLILFDAPEATQSIGDRGTTTQPTQALAMMNSPLVHQTAEELRKRVFTKGTSPTDTITTIYRVLLSRAPTDVEMNKMISFFSQQKTMISANDKKTAAEAEALAMSRVCQVVLCLNEFIYVD